MNAIRTTFQPLVIFVTEQARRSLNALQSKTNYVAIAFFGSLAAYLVYRLCLKDRGILHSLPLEKVDNVSVCYQGHEDGSEKMSEQRFQELVREFKVYMRDPDHRKDDLHRPHPLLVRVPNGFKSLEEPHLDAFMRYLVVEGVGVAYRQAQGGYCLYLSQEVIAPDTSYETSKYPHYTRQKLVDVHRQLQALSFPVVESYPLQLRSIVGEVCDSIRRSYYQRFNDGEQTLCRTLVRINAPHVRQVMDQLVCEYPDLVYAWNACAQKGDKDCKVILRLSKDDPIDDSAQGSFVKGTIWRDRALIEKEKAFQKNNQISISTEIVNSSTLVSDEKTALNQLVSGLNKRIRPGVYLWSAAFANESIHVLQFLRAQGVIYAYQRVQDGFHIWVKLDDADKMQICYQGHQDRRGQMTEECFQEALEDFKVYKETNPDSQKEGESCVYVSSDSFGKTQKLDYWNLEMFMRYLLLQNEGIGYRACAAGFKLYLTEEAITNEARQVTIPYTVETRKQLVETYSQLLALPFPPLESYSVAEQGLIKPVLDKIQKAYCERFMSDDRSVAKISIVGFPSLVITKMLDQLIDQSPALIDAWAYHEGFIIVRLQAGDTTLSDQDTIAWRTQAEIDAEKAFKEANRIDLTDVDVSSLNEAEQKELRNVVEELNERVKHGPYSLKQEDTHKAVFEFLQARHLIMSHDSYFDDTRSFDSWRTICCVKKEDHRIYEEQLEKKRREEEAFQAANRIEGTPDLLEKSDLDESQKYVLRGLVEALNKRRKAGVHYCSAPPGNGYDYRTVLEFLKKQRLIYNYKEKTTGDFHIYVKQEDK